ncbi:hypothetical protein ACFOET_19515 [Parapedobacter deserti]|uniref:Microcystin-dependent protein n=2 Tax=Parapedobacter deserti TaxID=1912957 RepID=A0ABV7JP93_9SPHI
MKSVLTLCFLSAIALFAEAQTGINNPAAQAALDISSTEKGILIARMTALQAEAIATPHVGELVYATTADGTAITHTGFWFYNGAEWRPFSDNPLPPQNIYVSDGTLTSDRTVGLAGHNLHFDADKLSILAADQRVGIGEANPVTTVDVNGNVRVRSLSEGNVVALADGTLAVGPKVAYGTIKESLRQDDHNGWYLLDGRAINTLSATAQANASAIGLSGSLANANSRLARQGAPLLAGGANAFALTQAHLPAYNMTGTTSTAGAHTHSVTPGGHGMTYVAGGNAALLDAGGTVAGTTNVALPSAGAHTHGGFVNSGGSGTAFSIIPESITFTYFIYLGE